MSNTRRSGGRYMIAVAAAIAGIGVGSAFGSSLSGRGEVVVAQGLGAFGPHPAGSR